jgi:hypothetical protein
MRVRPGQMSEIRAQAEATGMTAAAYEDAIHSANPKQAIIAFLTSAA